MTSLPTTTVARLDARLHEQMRVVATLRLAVDMQAMRTARVQPELFPGSHRRQSPFGFGRERTPIAATAGRIERQRSL